MMRHKVCHHRDAHWEEMVRAIHRATESSMSVDKFEEIDGVLYVYGQVPVGESEMDTVETFAITKGGTLLRWPFHLREFGIHGLQVPRDESWLEDAFDNFIMRFKTASLEGQVMARWKVAVLNAVDAGVLPSGVKVLI